MPNLYQKIRRQFPEFTKKADLIHLEFWGEIDPEDEDGCLWFESLAKALNQEMLKSIPIKDVVPLFECVRSGYLQGSANDKDLIDVVFVENLFWQIPPDLAEVYWSEFPQVLKELFLAFHKYPPLRM